MMGGGGAASSGLKMPAAAAGVHPPTPAMRPRTCPRTSSSRYPQQLLLVQVVGHGAVVDRHQIARPPAAYFSLHDIPQ